MSYQVLARKWRPRNFAELVGQQHVVKVLANSLAEGRVHHAFLFTGTRGVGKTTIARILAKSLNCLEGVTAEPCGQCEHCVAIDEGRFVDLLEIDAASRTRVDDTREILDNVQYAPARGRYKVYLIDEVHMLSTHSFNALLKTLEEPPDHVKFVLATTDPQKIPVTILSRCLQFNLRRLSPAEIGDQMIRILEAEKLKFEADAVSLLARAADGSMRDGLSLLDQALAGGGALAENDVRDMLGSVERRHVHDLVSALADRDAGRAMAVVAEVFAQARDLGQLLLELAEALHRLALIQTLPDYRDDTRADWDSLLQLAGRIDPEDLQLYYQIAITGRRDLDLAPSARTGCEMTVLRMLAFRPADLPEEPALDQGAGASRRAPQTQAGSASRQADAVVERIDAAPRPAESVAGPAVSEPGRSDGWRADRRIGPDNWAEVIERMKATGSVRMVAGLLVLEQVDEPQILCRAAADDMIMLTDSIRDSLERCLAQWLGGPVRLVIRPADGGQLQTPARQAEIRAANTQAEAEAAIENDPLVRKLRDRFGAEVLRESIRPNETRSH